MRPVAEIKVLSYSKPSISMATAIQTNGKKRKPVADLTGETNPGLIFDAYLRPPSIENVRKIGASANHVELEARNEVKWKSRHQEDPD